MARKPAAKPAPAEPVRDPITLPEATSFTSDVRTLLVNITILLAIVLVVPVIIAQFWRSQVVIEPLNVPSAMVDTGLTPEVAAGRLWDGLEAVTDAAGTAKRSVVSIPESAKVDFAIPDSGLSIDSLVYYVRQFFNSSETRISGEFRCADASCAPEGQTLRIRVIRNSVDLIDMPPRGDKSEEAYFRDAAAEVMTLLDPFTSLAAVATTDPERGKVLARRLIRSKHPDAKWAHNLLGNLLSNEGATSPALAEYDAALAIDPDFAPALANRGAALVTLDQFDAAKVALDKALSRDKNDIYALSAYADMMEKQGRPDDAVAYLQRAADVRPLPPVFLDRAGMVLFKEQRRDEAVSYFEKAVEVDPGDPLGLVMLGLLYSDSGRPDESERVYRAAAEYYPKNAGMQADHAVALRVVHKFDDALARVDRALELEPENPDHYLLKAKVLIDLVRGEDALASLAEADRLQPGNVDVIYARADAYRVLGDAPAAIAAYRKFLELAPADEPLRAFAEAEIVIVGNMMATETTSGATTGASSTQP